LTIPQENPSVESRKATSLEKEKPWGGEVHANGNGNGMGLVSKVCHHVNVTFIMLFL